jgi:U3 small nucleolar RNA-associated protein 16
MFSQIVTAARGLLSRPESNPRSLDPETEAVEGRELSSNKKTMVTATRKSVFTKNAEDAESLTSRTSSPVVNGKRKSISSIAKAPDSGRASKRPKTRDVEASDIASGKGKGVRLMEAVEIVSDAKTGAGRTASDPEQKAGIELDDGSTQSEGRTRTNHVRFGSEDPAPTPDEEPESFSDGQNNQSAEEESDDDAPEAVSNTTQLKHIRDEERKREQAKQR